MFRPLAFLALLTAASARKCTEIMVPVSLKAENAVFDLDKPLTKVDVTDFILNLSRQGDDFVQRINKGVSFLSELLSIVANDRRLKPLLATTSSLPPTVSPITALEMRSRS